ncbi:helix-turn-helix domain-containing protein [Eisenbergiella porci]|uniref:helix-turn-helix domain-containing protein n=1 Tax=Eisenbergiella porci TaxID=2652274 RepID=UPI002A81BD71|nr:AraC family transcriptional regulator [Eisenbergiella porci]
MIEENYCSRLTLDDIAEQVHLNKSYLSRLYKQKTGENLFDAINRLRIAKAREYIQAQSHMIYEVAGMVGFDDNAYFSRVFKKYTGMSPKEYEKRVKEGQGM